jgi:predicted TIM-barrel fold metal-dependent hydrolase
MPGGELAAHVASVPLVDHHVHGAFAGEITRAELEVALNEGSPDAVPPWMTMMDSQLGFAVRRWCAPVLDLPPHASGKEYWARRADLGVAEVTSRLLRAAGVSDWVIDIGYGADTVLGPDAMTAVSGQRAHVVLRLESVAEQLAAEGVPAAEYADEFRSRLAESAAGAVAVKSVLAYRCGFARDLSQPAEDAVREAAGRWVEGGDGPPGRLVDPVLLRFGLHEAVHRGLPIQLHTGFGDRDLDLDKVNPLLLLDFLRDPAVAGVPVMLLHCYPYHREAGYLAQAFSHVYFDVGLALNHVGVRSAEVVAESFELAPFAKQLYSSDAWGPPELHHLGAVLWRRAVQTTVGRWVDDGDWHPDDACRVVDMVAGGNARRVYGFD